MKIGVIYDGRATAQQITQWGELAEHYGFSHIWVASSLNAKDPFLRLSLVATSTSRVTLGAMAISPFDMHPVRIGMTLLTLHELARGRTAVVVGAGGDVTKTLGIPLKERVQATRECIEIVKQMATGREVHYQGRLFQVQGFATPWAHPTPPLIYVGANRPRMLRMAAEVGDGVMFSDMPPEYLGRLLADLKADLQTARRDVNTFRISNFFAWNVQPTHEEALRLAQRYMPLRLYYIQDVAEAIGVSTQEARRLREEQWSGVQALFRSAKAPDIPAPIMNVLTNHLTITNDVEHLDDCIERLREFEKLGLAEIALALYGDPVAGLRLLGEKVLPAFRPE